jgi:segregation and condensation protein A
MQKVDLTKISILALVEQYLAVIEGARRIRLELAADWLVMAAWLTWLKSRLLVPASPDDAEEGELAAENLAERLRELGAIRSAAAWLGVRRGTRATLYRPRALTLWTVQDALHRLGSLLGSLSEWVSLEQYLPDALAGPTERRAALASTLLAGLEMARDGSLHMRQDDLFGPILVRGGGRALEEGA